MLATALAVACAFAGVFLVSVVWKRPLPRKGWLLAGNWAVTGLSFYAWIAAHGVEYGTVYAFCCISLAAWVAVALRLERKTRIPRVVDRGSIKWLPPATFLKHAVRLGLTTVVAAAASFCAVMGVSRLVPIADMERHAFVIVLFPIVWGALIYAICRSTDLHRPLALTIAMGGAGIFMMLV